MCLKWEKLVNGNNQIYIHSDGSVEEVWWGDTQKVKDNEFDFIYCPFCGKHLKDEESLLSADKG